MNNQCVSKNALRKRNNKENETPDQRNARLIREREQKRQRRGAETSEEREIRLRQNRERKKKRLEIESSEERELRLELEREQRLRLRHQRELEINNQEQQSSATDINEIDRNLLKNFRDKMNKLQNVFCPVCKERFPSLVLVMGKCRRCYTEKISPNRFSNENNMDPGEVPAELQGLTEIEEMLIAKVFTVISVYRLRGGQYGYRGNVINFPQDVQGFVNRLPRCPSSLEILIVRRQSESNLASFRDFTVRRSKVACALFWLKANNRYYNDISIDDEVLQSLPENCSIIDQFQQIQDDQINEDLSNNEFDGEMISRTFVPILPSSHREDVAIKNALDRMQASNPPLLWPLINNSPINEFQTPGYIACAFPTLYPTGRADLRAERVRDVKPAEYFKHLLQYKDGRFARHTRWRYFALNSQMRWRALQEGKVYVKQNLTDSELTVADIQEKIAAGDKYMADRIMRFGIGLRGSRQFWNARRSELSDMIKQLGSQGMIFFTFSSADLHWPELHDLMPQVENSEDIEASKIHYKNLVENPHIAAWFFNKRFEIFFNDVLKRQWNLEDWWYRFEWQHRGSVHVHGIGKIQNAPSIEWAKMKDDENTMNQVVKYLKNLVTTMNPRPIAPIPDRHPCQKRHDELNDDIQDYVDLINKLQRHTRCSPSYCLRVNKTGQQTCRFGYPKEIIEHTFVRDDGRGQPELVTARNDPLINPHSRIQLQGWRANVDLKPVLSIHAALQYISKYASKSEPRSVAFTEIFNGILCNSQQIDPSLTSVQKLLLHSVAERDISSQETCHLLLGIPLYHSSRSFISLNLNKEAPRWLRDTGNERDDDSLAADNAGRTACSPLQIYWDRPTELENFSLFQLNLLYKFANGHWNRCKQDNIIRIWPRPASLREGPQWEEYCRIKVLLHVRNRNIQHLTEDGNISWSTIYNRHIEEIDADPMDVLGPPIDNENDEVIEEYDAEEYSDEEPEDEQWGEFRPDWMLLSKRDQIRLLTTLLNWGLATWIEIMTGLTMLNNFIISTISQMLIPLCNETQKTG